MLFTSLALSIALQGASQSAVAVKNDNPETWSIEYPRIISPFIEDYRKCLNASNRMVQGKANFEEQHRADVPRCDDVKVEAEAASNKALAGRGEYDDYTPENVKAIFEHIGLVHIARGADLDGQFTMLIQGTEKARAKYEAERPKGLVIELRDATVVKERAEASQLNIDANPEGARAVD